MRGTTPKSAGKNLLGEVLAALLQNPGARTEPYMPETRDCWRTSESPDSQAAPGHPFPDDTDPEKPDLP